jgi:deoxycytidylate deaminase
MEKFEQRLSELTDKSTTEPRFAAVIVKDGEIISEGYSQELVDNSTDDRSMIHAEESTLLFALKNKRDVFGSDIYVLGVRSSGEKRYSNGSYCCPMCARMIMQTEIENIHYPTEEGWKIKTPMEMWKQAKERFK